MVLVVNNTIFDHIAGVGQSGVDQVGGEVIIVANRGGVSDDDAVLEGGVGVVVAENAIGDGDRASRYPSERFFTLRIAEDDYPSMIPVGRDVVDVVVPVVGDGDVGWVVGAVFGNSIGVTKPREAADVEVGTHGGVTIADDAIITTTTAVGGGVVFGAFGEDNSSAVEHIEVQILIAGSGDVDGFGVGRGVGG